MLKLEDLSIKRDRGVILEGVNLEVKSGEIYGLLGPNRGGKTTLAQAIMGCNGYKPHSGRIIFEERVINEIPIWERARLGITLAWQEEANFEGISVEKYLSLGMKNKHRDKAEKALKTLLLDPEKYMDRKVDHALSGGERKRIELAAVLAMHPRLAILDEPDSGIDILTLDSILGFIQNLRKNGTTVILITHRSDVAGIADRAALLGEGRMVKEGTAHEIVRYFEEKCLVCPKFR